MGMNADDCPEQTLLVNVSCGCGVGLGAVFPVGWGISSVCCVGLGVGLCVGAVQVTSDSQLHAPMAESKRSPAEQVCCKTLFPLTHCT